ncbi:uncharacterized protein LOC141660213 [Apium graveolens]|uniref:uncharacterized protein LOC141660213 n=1 Tax=Apium graveolens TaxID=4045 RepID=UPI003D7B739D
MGHIYDNGFCLGYVHWVWHGETASTGPKSSSASCPPEEQAPDPPPERQSKIRSMSLLRKLLMGVHADATKCPKCRLSRWKLTKKGEERINLPAKVMWYFPIIPRFKRMFKSPSTTELMCWHAQHRKQDGKMRHPADSPSWKNIYYRWPSFGSEPRNLRLALSVDGVNPHNNGLSNRYSCWPVILVTYNLHPWLCMKRKFMMLSIMVPGPHEPGNNIDIYLQPMIDDLKKLWKEGEPNMYDAYNKSFFTLKAVLMWTINDFPAYGNLSGCVNKGYKCCPVCGDDTVAKYLTHSRKMCYQGHRRYLPLHHPYRRQKAAFNGQQEFGQPRRTLSGEEVLVEQEQIKFEFGKKMKKAKKVESPWKKKSVFFELEYWKFHHVRHCIDVMHVEKNVCDSLIGTLLNMRHKTKDSAAAHRDMMEMGVRSYLAPQVGVKKTYFPPSPFTLSKAEKRTFLSSLMSMKLPYGHASNIKNCVSMPDLNIYGLKSHDCHILLQQLLPVAIHSVLSKHVRVTIIRLCFFFNALCNKVVKMSKLDKLQSDVILTLCDLKKVFHASFFDVMVNDELRENNKGVSDTIRWLVAKPSFSVLTYQGYLVNGVRYFTKERDDICVVQNSGVSVIAKAVQVSSAKDLNPVESYLTFYGIIQEIWELDYHAFKAPLFLYKWASNDKGIRVYDLGFTLVDFSRQGHKKDKYVFVDQVKQVFYLEDPVDATWSIVLSSTTRDYHELYNEDDLGDTIMEHPPFYTEIPATDVTTDDVAHTARPNVEGI